MTVASANPLGFKEPARGREKFKSFARIQVAPIEGTKKKRNEETTGMTAVAV